MHNVGRRLMAPVSIGILVLLAVAACGVTKAADQVTTTSASPTPAPTLATPGPSISPAFLAFVDSSVSVEPAPANASPAISQQDAETLARNYPPTNGVVNGSMLGECVGGQVAATQTPYLCWVIDGTSHEPSGVPGGPPTTNPSPGSGLGEVTYSEFYVIVDAQPGSPTAGTILTAAGH
jgi:hypothetical protein